MKGRILPLFLLAILAGTDSAFAQFDITEMLKNRFLGAQSKDQQIDLPRSDGANRPADNSINEDQYLVGSGDVFSISIDGLPSEKYTAEVNQNCDITIAKLGIVPVGKVSLAHAKTAISEWISQKLRLKNDVYVALSSTKRVSVFVGGVVTRPGTFVLSGSDRILDAINLAQGGTKIDLTKANYREVLVRSPEPAFFDVLAAISGTDSTQNLYLYPGMKIYLEAPKSLIYLGGEIAGPFAGSLPPKNGETIGSLVACFPLTDCADRSSVQISRSSGSGQLSGSLEELQDVVLRNGDAVTVLPKPDCIGPQYATIKGCAQRTGEYAIESGVTTAGNILSAVGGANQNGDATRAVLIRPDKQETGSSQSADNLFRMYQIQPAMNMTLPGVSSAFSRMRATKDYSVVRLSGTGNNVILRHGDIVYIPPKSDMVFVSGNVKFPGGYAYDQNNNYRDYVDAAGGYTRRADRRNVFVMTDYLDAVQFKDKSAIEEGDIIVVPDSQKDKAFQTIIVPLVSVAATVLLATSTLLSTFK